MKAKIAYLTSPAPDVFILNFQPEGTEGIERLEITKAHLSNIIIDGASFALREQYPARVSPETPNTGLRDDHSRRQPA